MPRVSAVCGFSPHDRTRRPHGVRNSTNQVAATITNIAKKIGLLVKS